MAGSVLAFRTAGDLTTHLRDYTRGQATEVASSWVIITYDVGFRDGFGAVLRTVINVESEEEFETYLMALDVQEGSPVTLQAFLSSAGFDCQSGWDGLELYLDHSATPAEVVTVWESLFIGLKRDMIDQWTTGTTASPDVTSMSVGTTPIIAATADIRCTDTAGPYTSCERVIVGVDVGAEDGTYHVEYFQSGLKDSSPSFTSDMTAVVEAINQLGFTNLEISFNHGANVFSITGGFITG